MRHRTLGWLVAVLVSGAHPADMGAIGQGAIGESLRRPRASICGRVVMMSCTSPQSGVSLTVSAPSGLPSWELIIPPEYRSLFGTRIEDRYDQRLVCVTVPAPLGTEKVVVTGPEQILVQDAEPPHPLPADVARTCDPDVRLPRATHSVAPSYPPTAMMAKVAGSVVLRGVVERDGAVGEVRVVRSLEPTLDEAAVKALALWTFQPATRRGEPVAMAVSIEMSFSRR